MHAIYSIIVSMLTNKQKNKKINCQNLQLEKTMKARIDFLILNYIFLDFLQLLLIKTTPTAINTVVAKS